MASKITFSLPVGTAVFPKLDKVDVYQPVDKKGRPMGDERRFYMTNVKFSDEDHRKVHAMLEGAAKELDAGPGRPWKTDKKTGDITLQAKSGEKYPPFLVDAKNNRLPKGTVIGGGSKIRINVTVNDYPMQGGGINLYLSAVQVIELAQRGSPFEATEGYEAPAEAEDTKAFDPHEVADDAHPMDDEIPF
jgi:hypothetical protein